MRPARPSATVRLLGEPLFRVVVRPLQAFLRTEASGGILLLVSAIAALAWANLHPESYRGLFELPLAVGAGSSTVSFSLRALISDGLMAIFFFVVGMEIKRELVLGELNTTGKALLPAIAAVGGMVLPMGFYLMWNWGGEGARGWAIPMATDIAFCVGVLTVMGDRVPRALVVFVTAIAIFDDIGGILVIAAFYGHGLQPSWLLAAAVLSAMVIGMGRSYVRNGLAYAIAGAGLWYLLHHGGIHATISGVIVGVAIPARVRRPSREIFAELEKHVERIQGRAPDEELDNAELAMIQNELEDLESPLGRFIHVLHPIVAFGIMPLFALANAGVSLRGVELASLATPVAIGTAVGLLVGKLIGIFSFTFGAVMAGLTGMPGRSLSKLLGASAVAGIGFTVALFIATLAFASAPALLDQAKVGILLGSLSAGLVGYVILRATGRTAAT